MKHVFIAAVILTLCPALCAAESEERLTSSYLRAMCDRSNEAAPRISVDMCLAYIKGFRSGWMLAMVVARQPLKDRMFCIPQTINNGALIEVFNGWADRNTGLGGVDMDIGLMSAFVESFPCQK